MMSSGNITKKSEFTQIYKTRVVKYVQFNQYFCFLRQILALNFITGRPRLSLITQFITIG